MQILRLPKRHYKTAVESAKRTGRTVDAHLHGLAVRRNRGANRDVPTIVIIEDNGNPIASFNVQGGEH